MFPKFRRYLTKPSFTEDTSKVGSDSNLGKVKGILKNHDDHLKGPSGKKFGFLRKGKEKIHYSVTQKGKRIAKHQQTHGSDLLVRREGIARNRKWGSLGLYKCRKKKKKVLGASSQLEEKRRTCVKKVRKKTNKTCSEVGEIEEGEILVEVRVTRRMGTLEGLKHTGISNLISKDQITGGGGDQGIKAK